MNKTDKIREGHIQIDNKHNYRPLTEPMVKEMHTKVLHLITDLQHENHNGNRNMRELNKLSVVHFKGSAQLTQFPPLLNINCTEVYLGPLYRSYIIIQIFNCKIPERVLLNGAILWSNKGFQRFHTGEDVRPATSCKFLLQCFPDSALLCQWNNIRSQQTCSWAVHHCKKKSTFKWEQLEQHILNEQIICFHKKFYILIKGLTKSQNLLFQTFL